MDGKLKKLEEWGCKVEEIMERFLDDEEFYFDCYRQVMTDPAFEELGKALENMDTKGGFDLAHTLKGIVANIGVTPMENILSEMVEKLRVGEIFGVSEMYERLMEIREKFMSIM